MTIDRMLSLFATIVSLVAVPASGYFSYRYAIKGEKRKEWNALVEPVLSSLEEINHFWLKEQDVHVNHIPLDNIERLRRRMTTSERAKFDTTWEELESVIRTIKSSPAPLMWSADGSHKEPWESPYPLGVVVSAKLLKLLRLR